MKLPEFTDDAKADLQDIHDYIARDNPDAAERTIETIEEMCYTLADNPMIGRARPEFGREIRSFPARSYIIFYRPVENGVEIVHVIHGARDITGLF